MPEIKQEYLTEAEVSELTGIPVKTLQGHRQRGTGLPFTKIGRLVRYSKKEINNYLTINTDKGNDAT